MSHRGSNKKSLKTRYSAGGANRTNLHGAIHRPSEDSVIFRPTGSDLMPPPRRNNFRPWNSCLVAAQRRRSPPRQWMPPRYSREHLDRSPEVLFDDKGRPVPKRGMFMNAKYSHHPMPSIDEDRVRRTEEVITRMLQKGKQKHQLHHPNYSIRDHVRQTVYNLGVPENYRIRSDHYPPEDHCEGTSRSRHYYSKRFSREDEGSSEEDDDEVFYKPKKSSKKRSNCSRKNREQEEESEEDEEEEEISKRSRKRIEKKKEEIGRKKRRKRERSSSSDESQSDPEKSIISNCSRKNTSNVSEGRGSKASSTKTTPRPSTSTTSYIRDSDEDDNWKKSIPFLCEPDGPGAAMLERIGSAITTIPLKDDSTNSYSKVALMLLEKSIKQVNHPPPEESSEQTENLQTQLLNMSTCWVRPHQTRDPPKSANLKETTLSREISRILNPQNATTIQMDQSIFRNCEDLLETRKSVMPPPLFRSSPRSSDLFKNSDGITMISSIRKEDRLSAGDQQFQFSDQEEAEHDLDDYIAKGASQLDFSLFSDQAASGKSAEIEIQMSSKRTSSSDRLEKYIQSSSKSKTDISTFHVNSRFIISPSRKSAQPMLDIDEETQKMFDNVFDTEKKLSRGDKDRNYLF